MILRHYGMSGAIRSEHHGAGATVDKAFDAGKTPARREVVLTIRRDHDTRGVTVRVRAVDLTMSIHEATALLKQLLDALI